jgi:hypothetical protein
MSAPAAEPGSPRLQLRADGLECMEVDGEVVLVDTNRSVYYAVNATGGSLWTPLRAGTTEVELRRVLVDERGVSEERAAADVAAFLAQLTAAGLLDRAPAL